MQFASEAQRCEFNGHVLGVIREIKQKQQSMKQRTIITP
jgi:hypothetical protein